MRGLALLPALPLWAISSCCGGEDGDTLIYHNDTPYFVHFLQEDEPRLWVPPGAQESVSIDSGQEVTVVIAPAQPAAGHHPVTISCCDGGCGTVEARWTTELDVYYNGPSCGSGWCRRATRSRTTGAAGCARARRWPGR